MEAKIFNQSGAEVGTIQLEEYIFGIEPNVPVMHQAMVRQQANARLGTSNTLRRGEVQGSTRKLYKQKGTGRARAGSIRAPNRKGGGVAHGPHPRSYRQDMPRKMRRLAVRSALSAKFAADEIRFVEEWSFERPRTKEFLSSLASLNLDGKTLLVLAHKDQNVQKSANNVAGVKTLLAGYLNVIDLLQYDNVVISSAAIDVIDSWLGQGEAVDDADDADEPDVIGDEGGAADEEA